MENQIPLKLVQGPVNLVAFISSSSKSPGNKYDQVHDRKCASKEQFAASALCFDGRLFRFISLAISVGPGVLVDS